MSEIIPFSAQSHPSGFTTAQFRMLDALYLQAASRKQLIERAVDCDFDEGVATYTYFKAKGQPPFLQFVIRRVGPRTSMYEVYAQGRGRIAKSGVFDYAYKRLRDEIAALD